MELSSHPGIDEPSYGARLGDCRLVFRPARGAEERSRIFDLREAVYRGGQGYLLRDGGPRHPAEDDFDAGSLLFSCREGARLVSSCRFTPPRDGRWELDELSHFSGALDLVLESTLQVGRVVVHPDRRSLGIAEVMMYFSCHWLTTHTGYRSYFAVCLPQLVRFYRHFGVRVWPAAEIRIQDRPGNSYSLIYGDLCRSREILHEHVTRRGWIVHDVLEAAPASP